MIIPNGGSEQTKNGKGLDRIENDDLGATFRLIEERFDLLPDAFFGQRFDDLSPPRFKRRHDHAGTSASKFGNEHFAIISRFVLRGYNDKRPESKGKILV